KNTSVSNLNLARSALKRLITQTLSRACDAATGGRRLFNQPPTYEAALQKIYFGTSRQNTS
ncbi:MAG: hypothetical protein ACOYOO_08880, partial [Saprospiraceae bacterium]